MQAATVLLSSTGAGKPGLLWRPCQWHVKNTIIIPLLRILSVQQRFFLASVRTKHGEHEWLLGAG